MTLMTTHKRNSRHAGTAPRNQTYPWPLLLIAAPAAVAIWSGWVGLGSKSGFGPVNLAPGIGRGFTVNTAITLPVGIESYGVYAMFAWLTLKGASERTRDFARKSAVGALALGCFGQIAYHLMAAAGWAQAPWPVVMIVSCLPVLTVYLGAALTHMIVADRRAERDAELAREQARAEAERLRAERAAARAEAPPRKPAAKRTGTRTRNQRVKPAGTRTPEPVAAEPEPIPEPEPAEAVSIDAEARILQLVAEGHSASEAGVLAGRSDSYGRQVVRKARELEVAAPKGRDPEE